MEVERCDECGFDGGVWETGAALDAIETLPGRWRTAVAGLSDVDTQRRPIPDMWSIAEYADHVRETLFGMRFVLDVAVGSPGTNLGEPPEPEFAPAPKPVEISTALVAIESEAKQLASRLRQLAESDWASEVGFGSQYHDVHWICRHAVHDASHHLDDVARLRAALIQT